VWSFVHLDDAATATALALEHGISGIYNVVDDDPAPVREWLPAMARALGAKEPPHIPRWLARIVGGATAVTLMTEIRGSSNAKAKRELHWTLRYPSWRQGFVAAYQAQRSAARSRRRGHGRIVMLSIGVAMMREVSKTSR
jgi:nucleoside-diphosphate-sugar epimerase